MQSLSTALDLLYGASITYTVRKKGENQCLGFIGSFIDEAYAPDGEHLLEPMADLLGELLLDPLTKGGRFLSEYVESENAKVGLQFWNYKACCAYQYDFVYFIFCYAFHCNFAQVNFVSIVV